ncbi:MAG TPA: energy-coupling factor transporter transmembrane component T [Coprothermobacter proteolyticus]|nr:energy-coupling factor transporter transmembrane component T [Coprothermobacter proteolyticus]HPZ44969.1 energy-coupling factor transporter transmembrane component T [Coprothermobacter proteolyticus]HQD07647.1 energy-coupling factor transporter transmembrane component T [Coprothermobacter proteolyticus]
MARALSLYVEADTFVQKLDPMVKLLYILVAVLISFVILPFRWVGAAFIVLSCLALLYARVFARVVPLLGFSFLILISIVIIQGLFMPGNKTPAINILGLTFYKEGLLYALTLCIRVLDVLLAFALLVLTTRPSDLIQSLVKRGLSPRFGYVLSSALQVIPQMMSQVGSIMDAQRSRGLETEGNLWTRLKAFLPLIGPVVMSSLLETRERAMALEVRGFSASGKKTFLYERESSTLDRVLQWTLIVVLILSIAARFVLV